MFDAKHRRTGALGVRVAGIGLLVIAGFRGDRGNANSCVGLSVWL